VAAGVVGAIAGDGAATLGGGAFTTAGVATGVAWASVAVVAVVAASSVVNSAGFRTRRIFIGVLERFVTIGAVLGLPS
jgi:hypothetical protein